MVKKIEDAKGDVEAVYYEGKCALPSKQGLLTDRHFPRLTGEGHGFRKVSLTARGDFQGDKLMLFLALQLENLKDSLIRTEKFLKRVFEL